MLFNHALVLGLLATVGVATPDPQYQKPTTINAVNDAGIVTNTCDDSTFNVLAGQGDIATNDCLSISDGWVNTGDFDLFASDWVNTTADADHFFIYETQGTCEFAFKRTDGFQDQVTLGSFNLENLVASAVGLQGGNSTVTIQPVEGIMACDSANGSAQIEWTLRKPM
ncbi:unnamed protein product [Discula destructiva]